MHGCMSRVHLKQRLRVYPEEYGKSTISMDTRTEDASTPKCVKLLPDVMKEVPTAQDASNKSLNKIHDKSTKRHIFLYRLGRHICLVAIVFSLGMFLEMTGPTLPDLCARLQVNYADISKGLMMKDMGALFGSVLGGFLSGALWKYIDLLLAVALVTAATVTLLVPWTTSVPLFGTALFGMGLSEGVLNAGTSFLMLSLWGDKAASPMQSLHFGFAFGAIIAPQIARPFLSPDKVDMYNSTSNPNSSFAQHVNGTSFSDQSQIEYAFLIPAIYTFLLAFVVLGFYVKKAPKGFVYYRPKTRLNLRMLSPGSCADGNHVFGFAVLFLLFLLCVQFAGGERVYSKFLLTFAVESDLKFTKEEATALNSAFWAGFVSGRGSSIIIARWVPPKWFILIDIILTTVSAVVLALIGYKNRTVFWIFTCLMGYFISPLFPAAFSWANLHLNMNSFAVSILFAGAGTGGFLYQLLGGHLIQNYGVRSLMYLTCGCGASMFLIFVLLLGITHMREERSIKEKVYTSTSMGDKPELNGK